MKVLWLYVDFKGKTLKKVSLVLFCTAFLIVFASPQTNAGSLNGEFTIQSGDGKQFQSSDLKGKVSVLFYETKDAIEQNRQAKDQLNTLFSSYTNEIQQSILRLPVVDCSNASKLFHGIWKKKLIEHSQKEGMVIYGDWKGDMKKAFSFQEDEVYLIIINQQKNIVFSGKGTLNQEAIDTAIQTLKNLIDNR